MYIAIDTEAYPENYRDRVRYAAEYAGPDGSYMVYWETTARRDEMEERYKKDPDDYEAECYLEDGANACNWDAPADIRRMD